MSNARIVAVSLVMMAVCGIASAQMEGAPPAAPAMPPVEPVLTHIPAGAMGFVVINGIDNLLVKVEAFYNDIGAPSGEMPPLLQLLIAQTGLGANFNPNGGVAVVMLDPADFGIDLSELLADSMGGPQMTYVSAADEALEDDTPEEEEEEEAPAIPYVFFVPGQGPADVLPAGQFDVTTEGDYTVFTDTYSQEKMYAIQAGGYVLVSPNSEALEAVRSADSYFEDVASTSEFLAISQADAAAYIDMQVSAPVLADLVQMFAELSAGAPGMPTAYMSGWMSASLADVEEQYAQMEGVSFTFEFTETGLKFAQNITLVEGSQMAAELPGVQSVVGKSLVDKLPDLPYIFAGGMHQDINDDTKAENIEAVSEMLNSPEIVELLGQGVVDRIIAAVDEMYGKVNGVQFVVGGAPEGSGTIAAAFVFSVDGAQAMMNRLPDDLSLTETAINALIASLDGDEGLTITATENAEVLGGVPVTHVVINHPEMDEDEDTLQEIEAVLGMREMKFLVASPDANTVVWTFGGGSAMMQKTLDACQGLGDTVADNQAITDILAELPNDPYMLGFFSLGNLGSVGAATELAFDPDKEYMDWPLANMENTNPIAMGAAVDGLTIKIVAFAPTDAIADAVATVMAAVEASYQRMYNNQPGWNGAQDEEGPAEVDDPGF